MSDKDNDPQFVAIISFAQSHLLGGNMSLAGMHELISQLELLR